jgi:DNA-binding MarR family transcriptional regulator
MGADYKIHLASAQVEAPPDNPARAVSRHETHPSAVAQIFQSLALHLFHGVAWTRVANLHRQSYAFVMTDEEPLFMIGTEEVSASLYSLLIAVARSMPRDVSRTGVATLVTLAQSGPLRVTRLADLEGVAQPSMTLLADKLEQLELVERRRDPNDRRATLIALTPKGRTYLHQRQRIGAARLDELIGSLPRHHVRLLVEALPAIAGLSQASNRLTHIGSSELRASGGSS